MKRGPGNICVAINLVTRRLKMGDSIDVVIQYRLSSSLFLSISFVAQLLSTVRRVTIKFARERFSVRTVNSNFSQSFYNAQNTRCHTNHTRSVIFFYLSLSPSSLSPLSLREIVRWRKR